MYIIFNGYIFVHVCVYVHARMWAYVWVGMSV